MDGTCYEHLSVWATVCEGKLRVYALLGANKVCFAMAGGVWAVRILCHKTVILLPSFTISFEKTLRKSGCISASDGAALQDRDCRALASGETSKSYTSSPEQKGNARANEHDRLLPLHEAQMATIPTFSERPSTSSVFGVRCVGSVCRFGIRRRFHRIASRYIVCTISTYEALHNARRTFEPF